MTCTSSESLVTRLEEATIRRSHRDVGHEMAVIVFLKLTAFIAKPDLNSTSLRQPADSLSNTWLTK
jgi:hypothetical protein